MVFVLSINLRKHPVTITESKVKQDRISIAAFWQNCLEREIPLQPQGWVTVLKGVIAAKKKSNGSRWKNPYVHDAACGTGRVMEELHKQGIRVSGSDLSQQMLMEVILH
tara:strand:- start:10294 stop:10620 length:327 start_codon:yes stop_codon:yes gene_type:complete